jgi:hypothetical protein
MPFDDSVLASVAVLDDLLGVVVAEMRRAAETDTEIVDGAGAGVIAG